MGIDRKRYFEYFEGKNVAVGIFLKEIQKSKSNIPLTVLRNKVLNFNPPQSFRYYEENDIKRLKGYF
jgi:predicted transcriptional regulator